MERKTRYKPNKSYLVQIRPPAQFIAPINQTAAFPHCCRLFYKSKRLQKLLFVNPQTSPTNNRRKKINNQFFFIKRMKWRMETVDKFSDNQKNICKNCLQAGERRKDLKVRNYLNDS